MATRKAKAEIQRPEGLDPLQQLTRDLRKASMTLGDDEARFLVDSYYSMQEDRIRANHQIRQMTKTEEPHGVLLWLMTQSEMMEENIRRALDVYSSSKIYGQWAKSITGIGPVFAAGLMANLDINHCPTVGHIWSFAGLRPDVVWEKGQKRPWNASLKRLCFLMGESFTKFAALEDCHYGKIYRARRRKEIRSNDEGAFADQAQHSLDTRNFRDPDVMYWYKGCYPKGTFTTWAGLEVKARELFPDSSAKRSEWLNKERLQYLQTVRGAPGTGVQMLPPARILLRSQRYAVKLFLSHYHHVWYETLKGEPPPMPYILSDRTYEVFPELEEAMGNWPRPAGNHHQHYMPPPNWPMAA